MLTTRLYRACLAGCLSSLLVMGCGGDGKTKGPTGEVEGTVTMDGKPLTEGSITFYVVETGASVGAELGAGGKFKFDDPVPVGEYQVAFHPAEIPQPDHATSEKLARVSAKTTIPVAYQDESTSGIVADVKEGTNPPFEFKLLKKGPPRTAGSETPP